ncbi:glycoside hydrolase family 25 protein [Methyloligella sp. 2.7D]|uniref:glycoside hydrolase family 25 protein n=1 Tax=unclassified Methyloligella TaxID=2625955 RepID=UPI001FEF46B9|nr:glycoside hydrolase family 25 protein [Methyloligella sp. GL2]
MSDVDPHKKVWRAHRAPVQGIDVSQWQGDIDWRAVRAAGVQFAFIKATEGGDHIDPKFMQNWYAAKRAGIPRGAYHFVYWCRSAQDQARWFMRNVPRDPDALPPVLDVEWNHHSKSCPQKISRSQALAKIKILLDAMYSHTGMRPIIYTDPAFYRDVLRGELVQYPFWLRSVAAEPHEVYPGRPWAFWQFTTTGRVPGIRGDVDRNIFNGTRPAWERSIGLTQAASR